MRRVAWARRERDRLPAVTAPSRAGARASSRAARLHPRFTHREPPAPFTGERPGARRAATPHSAPPASSCGFVAATFDERLVDYLERPTTTAASCSESAFWQVRRVAGGRDGVGADGVRKAHVLGDSGAGRDSTSSAASARAGRLAAWPGSGLDALGPWSRTGKRVARFTRERVSAARPGPHECEACTDASSARAST